EVRDAIGELRHHAAHPVHVDGRRRARRAHVGDLQLEVDRGHRRARLLQRPRRESLLGADSKAPQIVITVDTASLVAAHEERIELCRINSGFAQPHNKVARNRQSFLPIADYPHRERAVANPRGVDIAELTVLGGVPDVAAHVVRVERVFGGEVLERLA
ncbi:MAG: hypothetical protein ABL886_12800, partial [Rhodoglobus sp.]